MNRIEKLILEIKRQLFPYRPEHDIERGCERWEVGGDDCLTSWMIEQLRNCRQKNGCSKKGMCALYSYSDLAKRNYDICEELVLLLENGSAKFIFERKSEKDDTAT
jgi:hypothetical protein